MDKQFDLAVIGAGPGGYVCAIRAAQLGLSVALIEKRKSLGGTCLNIGCIPSKALLDTTERYVDARDGFADHGITVGKLSFDLEAMMKRKEQVVSQLTSGVSTLMKKNSVEVITGEGHVSGEGAVRVTSDDGNERQISAASIVLAWGSEPTELPFLPFDGNQIVSSEEALSFESVPKRLVVVGAGAIGLEMGSVWARLGSEVTVIEIMDSILPGWDRQISRMLKKDLEKLGMQFMLSSKVTGYKAKKNSVSLDVEQTDATTTVEGEKVLVAVGRRPFHPQDPAELGLELDGGRVVVNERFETSKAKIYAIGDLVTGPMLAHKAEEDGVACAEAIAGRAPHVDYSVVPNVVYTWPEVASVGKTEEKLKEEGAAYNKGSFSFRANGRALAANEAIGTVKFLSDPDTDRVLGAHIYGPSASALIAEIVTAMALRGTVEDIGRIVHAHPTLPEAVKEAALATRGEAIHGA